MPMSAVRNCWRSVRAGERGHRVRVLAALVAHAARAPAPSRPCVLCIAGPRMCDGGSSSSCCTHSPRSVSTASTPASASRGVEPDLLGDHRLGLHGEAGAAALRDAGDVARSPRRRRRRRRRCPPAPRRRSAIWPSSSGSRAIAALRSERAASRSASGVLQLPAQRHPAAVHVVGAGAIAACRWPSPASAATSRSRSELAARPLLQQLGDVLDLKRRAQLASRPRRCIRQDGIGAAQRVARPRRACAASRRPSPPTAPAGGPRTSRRSRSSARRPTRVSSTPSSRASAARGSRFSPSSRSMWQESW